MPDHGSPAPIEFGASSQERSMAKKILGYIKLQVPAGAATP